MIKDSPYGWMTAEEEMRNEGQFWLAKYESPFHIVELLKACTAMKDLAKGCKLHVFIREHNFIGMNAYVGTALVNMYAKCGAISEAEQVLKELPVRNVVTWNALIAGYAQHGHGEEALKCFDDMLYEGHAPDAVTFVCVLIACGSIGAAARGEEIHAKLVILGLLEKDIVLGTTLVGMYSKCGALTKARRVHRELPVRNVFSCSILIAGYTEQGQPEEALKCFDDMLHEGLSPDAVTFTSALKACGSIGAVAKVKEIHDKIVSLGMLEKDIVLGNTLVGIYAKCGAVTKAQRVFEELPVRDVVTWSALIAGYAEHGQGKKALKCFDDMLWEGHSPTAVTLLSVLKACGSIGAADKGEEIHDKVVNLGILEKDIVLRTTLADMYMKCGSLMKAQRLLEEFPVHDVVSWSALIAWYAQQGQAEKALECFDDMLSEGHSPDPVTFICVIKACGSVRAASKGEEIHDKIVTLGMLNKDIVLGNALVDMYVKCGALAKAQQVLEEVPVRDVVTWNTLIAGYAEQGQGEQALKCFNDMLCEGHCPTVVTFVSVLKVCGSIGAAAKGEEIHETIVSLGMLEKDIVVANTLISMYMKCGALDKAQRVLDKLPARDVVTWNALISGYTEHGQGQETLKCFDDMLCEGHLPTMVTFICVLKACGSIGDAAKGKEIHDKIVSLGVLERDTMLGNTLVGMYMKWGAITKARQVLEELPIHDAISWNALIAGYALLGQGEEALKCFDEMIHEGHSLTVVTFICALKACGSLGALAKGQEIHSKIVGLGILEDIMVGNAMMDMYAKCGALDKARQLLEELPVGDVVTWSALIAGYAQQGQIVEVIRCFEGMESNGVKPNSITLISVLNACCHSGLLDQAETYFLRMSTKYCICPNLEHYCCMTDLFGRAGNFNKALSVIADMPSDKCLQSWVVLLSACRKWQEVKIGELAFERAVYVDESCASIYVLMADIHAAAGM